jgi:hypothetical protein
MLTQIKIRRKCACGCGEITNPGMRWIVGHNARNMSKDTKKKMSLSRIGNKNSLGYKQTEEHKRKVSLAREGIKFSKEHKLNMSLAQLKSHPDDEYCEAWRDREYRKDLRKDYCENIKCKGKYKRLIDHHINLNKKDCKPSNVMTLCNSCHTILHWKLSGKNKTNYKDFITIIKKDRITYIHKETKNKITVFRKI